MSATDERVETDVDGISYPCHNCGYIMTVGVDWEDDFCDENTCDECGAITRISVRHMGFMIDGKDEAGREVFDVYR